MKNGLTLLVTLSTLAYPSMMRGQNPAPSGTPITATCDCDSFKVSAVKIAAHPAISAGACIYNLMIGQTYPAGGHVPKGVKLTALSPATFAAALPGPLVLSSGFSQTPPTVPPVSTTVQWYGGTLPNNSAPQLVATIALNANGVSPQQVLVEWLDEDGFTMCHATLLLNCPCKIAAAVPAKKDLCFGQTTTVTLNPPPPSSAMVTWYKANAPCPAPIPSNGMPTTGWQIAQAGGNTCNTNVLQQSTCYQAVITEGPNCTYTSGVTTVGVARVANLSNLNPQPICKSGTNTFNITDPFLMANPSLVTWQGPGGITVATGVTTYTTPTLTATAPGDCPYHIYPYSVTVADSGCGPQTKSLPITVYHESEAGALVATPPGPLCYKQATKIRLPSKCGKVLYWEQSTNNGATWTGIPGAGTTSDFWTPELLLTTMYQVTVQNGTCPPVSSKITINVKPKLAVSLTSSGTMICNAPITLTANPSTGYPPPLTYKWFRNGVLFATTTSPTNTVQINQPGNYRVIISDPACGTAKSNVIRIYPRPKIVISGPCGSCQGKKITLTAKVLDGDPSCAYTFNWSAPGWTGATGQSVIDIPNLAPGSSNTYTVTTTCAGCTVSATHTVTGCPP